MTTCCSPKAELVKADPITSTYIYRGPTGDLVTLILIANSTLYCNDDSNRTIGRFVPGSKTSGSIWTPVKVKQCLGEYEFRGGSYYVTPYTPDGMKDSYRKEEIHPLDYLLRSLEQFRTE